MGRLPEAGHILSGMADAVRTAAERKADTITRLERDADVWVATASARAAPRAAVARVGRCSRHPRDSGEIAYRQECRRQR